MSEVPERADDVFCPACGKFNPKGEHFCANCMAPLSNHATIDPLGTVYAEGYAARRMLEQPPRPIILIGVWVWLFPLAFLSLIGLLGGLYLLVEGVVTLDHEPFISGVMTALPCGVLLFISYSLISRVTRKALRAKAERRAAPTTAAASTELEPVSCLSCQQSIPAGMSRCPACGWSYAAELESPTGEQH